MSAASDSSPHVPMHVLYGDEIRARAAVLRRQYPGCGIDFIVCSLEYDTGLRPAVLRRALTEETPA